MKKIYPTNVNSNRKCIETQWTKRILYSFYVLFLIILSSGLLVAQESRIYELTDNDAETKSLLSSDPNINVEKIFDLIQKLPPMIYIGENKVQIVTESNPLVLVLNDVQSFDYLHNNNAHYDKVELINIHINQLSDLNQKMDFSKISGFNELKYIYIQCNNIECSQSQIKSIILNSDPEDTILFQIITSS